MKRIVSILLVVYILVILSSTGASAVAVQRYSSKKTSVASTSRPYNRVKKIYVPVKKSTEELYQDIFITLLIPDIQKSIGNYYKKYLTQSPMITPDCIKVISCKRQMGYRSFAFDIKVKASCYIGPHLDVGDDNITISVDSDGAKVKKFEHIKSYYKGLPSNYRNIVKVKH